MRVVYFLECACDPPRIKIGRSNSAPERAKQLVPHCPFPTTLLCCVPGNAALEAAIHRRLRDSRACGEWFHDTPELRAIIRTVIDGSFRREDYLELEVEEYGDLRYHFLESGARRFIRTKKGGQRYIPDASEYAAMPVGARAWWRETIRAKLEAAQ